MTEAQRHVCALVLASLAADEIHHGDAIGADAEIDALAIEAGLTVVVHPPIKPSQRAFCKGVANREPRSYMARHRDIVDETELLIAAPMTSASTNNRQLSRRISV